MKTLLEALSAVLIFGASGYFCRRYLAFRLERLLDQIIEFEKRVRGGWYRKADPNERCPSCGHMHGMIFYASEFQRLMHHCNICNAEWPHPAKAEWPQNTRIPPGAWDLRGKAMKENSDRIESVREIFDRANAHKGPVGPKEEKNVN